MALWLDTLLVSLQPSVQGLYLPPLTYQTVWHLELTQLTDDGLRGWKHGVLGVEHLSLGVWDSNGLSVAFGFVQSGGLPCQVGAREVASGLQLERLLWWSTEA